MCGYKGTKVALHFLSSDLSYDIFDCRHKTVQKSDLGRDMIIRQCVKWSSILLIISQEIKYKCVIRTHIKISYIYIGTVNFKSAYLRFNSI